MFSFPKSTEYNKRIPKHKFYEQMDVSPTLKRFFVKQIRAIYWRNKIAATTLNVAASEQVTEVEVFEIKLTSPTLDETVLKQIDKNIPYHILFVLEYEAKYQAWIGYKEAAESGKQAFNVGKYYHTDWLLEDDLHIQLDGLNMDSIYENFVRQIAGDLLQSDKAQSLKESIAVDEKKQLLKKQIETWEGKIRKEKQFNKQIQMNAELKRLKKELEELYVS